MLLFYYIFDQINTALLKIREFQKHKNVSDSKLLNGTVYDSYNNNNAFYL